MVRSIIVLGSTIADEEAKVAIKYVDSDEGTKGYDFYYDGQLLQDGKWRFNGQPGSATFSRRNGFYEMDDFHFEDMAFDEIGSFSYGMHNGKELIKDHAEEPQTKEKLKNADSASNTFTDVNMNAEYITQEGYSQLSNVEIQQQNSPSPLNNLNVKQALATPGFGFHQHILYNHQGQFSSSNQTPFPRNQNMQLSSFIFPIFNQHSNIANHQAQFGSELIFGTPNIQQGNVPYTNLNVFSVEPISDQPEYAFTTNIMPDTSKNVDPANSDKSVNPYTTESSINWSTTIEPTSDIELRLDKDQGNNMENSTHMLPVTRRPIEGLPTSDEGNEEGGVLDDRINSDILKTLVG